MGLTSPKPNRDSPIDSVPGDHFSKGTLVKGRDPDWKGKDRRVENSKTPPPFETLPPRLAECKKRKFTAFLAGKKERGGRQKLEKNTKRKVGVGGREGVSLAMGGQKKKPPFH